jgi:hypothetical protein
MTTEIPNVNIISGTTVLPDSTILSYGTLEIDGSLNIPATGQFYQEFGANIQRLNDRVYVGPATAADAAPGEYDWLDAIIGPNYPSAIGQLSVLNQQANIAITAGAQSLSPPGTQFIGDVYTGAIFGINNNNYTPTATAWTAAYPNYLGKVVLNNGNLYKNTTAGNSWSSPNGPSTVRLVVGDGTAVWAHANTITWQPSSTYVVNSIVCNAGNYYICTTAGTSAASGGPTGTGASITDGTAIWQYLTSLSASTAWQPSFNYSVLHTPIVNGTNYYLSTKTGTSAGPAGPTGTGSNINDGGVVWCYQSPSAWQPSQTYAVNSVVTNAGYYYVCTTAGASAAAGGPNTTGTSISDGTVVWTYAAPSAWQASQAYALNNLISNGGSYYVCTTAGTSAGPAGPAGTGSTITDGEAVWEFLRANYIPPRWQPSHSYSVDDIILNGMNTYICTTAGTSANSGGPSGGGNAITDGTVVWRAQQIYIQNVLETLYVETRHFQNKLAQISFNSEMDMVVCSPIWLPLHNYSLNDLAFNDGNTYLCITAGQSASVGGPSGTSASISDGTVVWSYQYAGAPTGRIDPYLTYQGIKTAGLMLSNGRPDVASGDVTVALGIINNAGTAYATSGRYTQGIVVHADSILGTSAFNPGSGCAVALASGHAIEWFAPIRDAWRRLTVYAVGSTISHVGNRYVCRTAGTSASSGGPSGTGSSIADGSVVWAYAVPAAWLPSHTYSIGDVVATTDVTNGATYYYVCTTGGTSGNSGPPAGNSPYIPDGSVVWAYQGTGASHDDWQPNYTYVPSDVVYNGGNSYLCLAGGTSAASGGPSGTGFPIIDNTVTWGFQNPSADGGELVSAIQCMGTTTNQLSLVFADTVASFQTGYRGPTAFSIAAVQNATMALQVHAAGPGSQYPQPTLLAHGNSRTGNVDLMLAAQGNGYLKLGTPSGNAVNPAHFSPTHRLAVKDASGGVYYLACSSKAW